MQTPWMDMTDLAEYVRLRDRKTGGWNARAALKWIDREQAWRKRQGLEPMKLRYRGHGGCVVLIHRDDVHAAMPERKAS